MSRADSRRFLALAAIAATLILGSCGSSGSGPVNPTTCAFLLAISQPSIAASGGGGSATVTPSPSTPGCTWNASTDDSWLSLSGTTNGSASGSFNYTASANAGSSQRGSNVVLSWTGGGPVKQGVTQAGVTCTTGSLSVTAQAVGGAGGTFSSRLTTDCTWSAASDATWITITSSQSGTGSQDINYRVDSTATSRSAPGHLNVTIGGTVVATLTVTQSVSNCVITLSPSQPQTVSAVGGTFNLAISASQACASWRAFPDPSFVTIVGKDNGTGDLTIQYKVDANSTGARTGHVTVTAGNVSAQLTINQGSGQLSASFTISSNTGLTANNCRVDTNNDPVNTAKIRCTFDASASTGPISKYEFVLVNTGKSLGTGVKISDTPTSCGFPYETEVTIQLTITASDGRQATFPVKAVLHKQTPNGPC